MVECSCGSLSMVLAASGVELQAQAAAVVDRIAEACQRSVRLPLRRSALVKALTENAPGASWDCPW